MKRICWMAVPFVISSVLTHGSAAKGRRGQIPTRILGCGDPDFRFCSKMSFHEIPPPLRTSGGGRWMAHRHESTSKSCFYIFHATELQNKHEHHIWVTQLNVLIRLNTSTTKVHLIGGKNYTFSQFLNKARFWKWVQEDFLDWSAAFPVLL